ncbi:uncharacterized protein [Triticum aestivum]|uniref:uncharacterized protein n=1 Tax=Triticum aestivum TaxID=4565 RepID=UPI001D00C3AB|nr:uncharacterized protein LOC123101754 [Triticum aestivum]
MASPIPYLLPPLSSPNPVSLAASLLQSHSPFFSSLPSLQNSNCDAAPPYYSRGSPSLMLAIFFSASRNTQFPLPCSLAVAGTAQSPAHRRRNEETATLVGLFARPARIAWRPLTLQARPLAVFDRFEVDPPAGKLDRELQRRLAIAADSSSWSALPFPLPSEHIGHLRLLSGRLHKNTSANLPGRLTTGSSHAATTLIAGPSPPPPCSHQKNFWSQHPLICRGLTRRGQRPTLLTSELLVNKDSFAKCLVPANSLLKEKKW